MRNRVAYAVVIPEQGRANEALVLATAMRRAGQATELVYRGNPRKVFSRAKAEGATYIVTVGERLRLWMFGLPHTVEGTAEELVDYFAWTNDASDTLGDPPLTDRMYPDIPAERAPAGV